MDLIFEDSDGSFSSAFSRIKIEIYDVKKEP